MNTKDDNQQDETPDSSEDQFSVDEALNKKFEDMQQTSGQGSVIHEGMHDGVAKTDAHSKHPDERKGKYSASESHSQDADRHHKIKHQISEK